VIGVGLIGHQYQLTDQHSLERDLAVLYERMDVDERKLSKILEALNGNWKEKIALFQMTLITGHSQGPT
jgi:hypothetical protein